MTTTEITDAIDAILRKRARDELVASMKPIREKLNDMIENWGDRCTNLFDESGEPIRLNLAIEYLIDDLIDHAKASAERQAILDFLDKYDRLRADLEALREWSMV